MLKTAAAIRHIHFEDLESFAQPIEAEGYRIQYYDVGLDALSNIELINAELLIVLGGPIGAYEEDKYPFLNEEIAVIKSSAVRGAADHRHLSWCAAYGARAGCTRVFRSHERDRLGANRTHACRTIQSAPPS